MGLGCLPAPKSMYVCMYVLETKAELVLSSPLDVTKDPGHA